MLLFSTFVKAVLLLVFWRIAIQTGLGGETELAAIISIIVGCYYALRQKEIKRFLAYSSIVHTGFLLLADVVSSILYLIIYIISSVLFFSVLSEFKLSGGASISKNESDIIYLTDLRYINFRDQPVYAVFAFIALASMAGIPPFGGFYIKLWVFTDLAENGILFGDISSFFLFIAAFATSLLTMLYYVRIANYILVGSGQLRR